MWKGNDKIDELYLDFIKIKKFPTICPICKKNSAHIYMHLHDAQTRRGGLWIWCSECYTFSHSSFHVPEYWENCPLVEHEKLCAIPDYLEQMKKIIDTHVNTIKHFI